MEVSTEQCRRVADAARGFLRRWSDRFTREHLDDLVQETVVESMRGIGGLRDPLRLEAFARTVARRRRAKAIGQKQRKPLHESLSVCEEPIDRTPQDAVVCIEGIALDRNWVLDRLAALLQTLEPSSRALLSDFYGGASHAELSARFSIPASSVKKRLYRSRRKLRALFLAHVRIVRRKVEA
jgi:RNA polymerase sigma factor (sigma-70 family)